MRRRICDVAFDIKSEGTTLSQNYATLKTLIESAINILLEQGYTDDEIPSLIAVTIIVFLGIVDRNAYHIEEVVSGLMPSNSPKLLNVLTQRSHQSRLRILFFVE